MNQRPPGGPQGPEQPNSPPWGFAKQDGSDLELDGRKQKTKKARKAEARNLRRDYEPPEINIVAMMDMMTIILIYLLASYGADPVQITPTPESQLAMSNTQLHPQEAIQVAITQKVILVDSKKVALVKNGRVAPEYKKDSNPAQMFIVPLYDALMAEGNKQKMFARYKKELEFKGLLTVIADKRIPFRLLTEVLYTAGKAEFGQYKFAVIKAGS